MWLDNYENVHFIIMNYSDELVITPNGKHYLEQFELNQ
jgi:hypothetical protein